MPAPFKKRVILRIIDANTNRLKEGLRVCEEITRFILNNRILTFKLKEIRHKVDWLFKRVLPNIRLVEERKIKKDIGKYIYINELERKDYQDVFFANIQRVKESMRVLEEFTKIINKNLAVEFKKLRYDIYGLEKIIARKINGID